MEMHTIRSLDRNAAAVILDAAQLLGSSLDPEITVNAILGLAAERLGLTRGRVVLPSEQGNELRIRYSHGLSSRERERGVYAPGEGVTGQVMATGKVAIVPDVKTEPMYLARATDTETNVCDEIAYVAVPILENEQPVGVIAAHPLLVDGVEFSNYIFVLQVLSAMIAQVLRIQDLVTKKTERLLLENESLKKACDPQARVYGILGKSPALRRATEKALRASQTDASVLLVGESGCGKERFSRMIHLAGERRDSPFVCINCAAIPPQLLESELFGHEKGSFTGATASRAGKFEMASGGTLFLDEIGDMEAELQGKLLRVLQEKKIQRIGGQRELDIDVRIIAATNQDLEEAVNHGQFRLDLYYRLNVIKISLPPLRQRDGDIRLLALYFLNRENQRYGANIVLAGSALERLESYHWPGNIRQLENVIERLVILAESELITASEVDQVLSEEAGIQVAAPLVKGRARSGDSKTTPATGDRPYSRVDHAERQTIEDALQSARGNKSLAARRLGLTSRQFRYRLDKLGIQ